MIHLAKHQDWLATGIAASTLLAVVLVHRGPSPDPEITIRIDATTTVEQFRAQRNAALGPRECVFEWGELAPVREAIPAAIAWPAGRIDGRFVCEGWAPDPRLAQILFVARKDGRLFAQHPSDVDRFPLETPTPNSGPPDPTLAFWVMPSDSDPPLVTLLDQIRWLPRIALIAMFD